ncbi:MAG: hypothetical protein U5L00_18850 [Desulfovermiculus sp.]|nr:hypothetical protein [Desulfovermiculus sp.]
MASDHSQIERQGTARNPMLTAGLTTLFWTLLVIALILACWYPAQRMLRIIAVDWAQRYDTFHASGHRALFPSMQAGHDLLVKRHKEAMSLIGFIDSYVSSHDLELQAENPGAWEPVLFGIQGDGRVYIKPKQWPLDWPEPRTTPPRNLLLRQGPDVQFLELSWLGPEDVFAADLAWPAKYPLRRYALLAGLILLGTLSLIWWRKEPQPPKVSAVHTTSGLMVRVSLILSLLGLVMAFTPHIYGVWDRIELGYGAFIYGLVLAVSGALSALIYYSQYARIRALLSGKDRLAHWTFSQPEWEELAQVIQSDQWRKNRNQLMITGLVFLAGILILPNVGGGLWTKIFGCIPLGLILALGVPVLAGRSLPPKEFLRRILADTACTWVDRPMSGTCFPFGW